MRAIRLAVWPLFAALFVAPAYGAEGSGQKMFGQERLNRLLAPIARCPDDLLDTILQATTYPLEVTQAARLMQANRKLSGSALESALADRTWDPSIKSLVNFPAILRKMNERDRLDPGTGRCLSRPKERRHGDGAGVEAKSRRLDRS